MTRHAIGRWLLILTCSLAGCASDEAVPANGPASPVEVYFSPKGGCNNAVLGEIAEARGTLLIQTSSLTSAPLAQALVDAHSRGVRVQVMLGKSQRAEKRSLVDFVVRNGIEIRIDDKHAILHNLVMIVDGEVVVTGSFNFTKAAEQHNADHVLVIRNEELAQKYLANWETHAEHSQVCRNHEVEVAADTPAKRRMPVDSHL